MPIYLYININLTKYIIESVKLNGISCLYSRGRETERQRETKRERVKERIGGGRISYQSFLYKKFSS